MRADSIPVTMDPRHLLIIGTTKFGKSRYAVEAANAGYELFYIDKDNGLATIQKDATPEAKKRIHYFNPPSFVEFVEKLLVSPVIYWNGTQNTEFQSYSAKPDDEIVEIRPTRMDKGVILCLDTWTSLAWSAMEWKAADLKIDLADADKWGREVYGNSGFRLTRIAKILQVTRCHQIVMAQPGVYEKKEKPPGRVGDVVEKDMIIIDTTEVPVSSSMPHGQSIGQYFNEIGWLVVDQFGQRKLDFTLKKGRLGAGTPNKILDPLTTGSWTTLWGPPPVRDADAKPWIEYYKASESEARRSAAAAGAPTLTSTFKAKVANKPT